MSESLGPPPATVIGAGGTTATGLGSGSREPDPEKDLRIEFDLLEQRIQGTIDRIEFLHAENTRLAGALAELQRESERMRASDADQQARVRRLEDERLETLRRLARLVEKIDALGAGH